MTRWLPRLRVSLMETPYGTPPADDRVCPGCGLRDCRRTALGVAIVFEWLGVHISVALGTVHLELVR